MNTTLRMPRRWERNGSRPAVPAGPGNLVFEDVTTSLGGREVVSHCSFALEPGRVTAMVGPSGCGKSTIAFLAAGYQRPSAGQVWLGEKLVRGPGPERLMVFQESALMPWMTVAENVMLGPRSRGAGGRESRRVAEAMLRRVGLEEFGGAYPTQLSGGMQRRAELARALVNEPEAMILDEPFRGLDAMTRGLMQEYLAELCEESSAATLFITTDIDEAILLADRLLIMTAAPTRVGQVIDVPLPRPRQRTAVLRDPRTHEIKQTALEALRVEATRQFTDQQEQEIRK
ncbi:MAG TPA: ABC transporter ATP-binding protein [Solirubrobacterales bacterium]|nr:ABC transporter ATP-binding protein [Solirubrobacterales bacterium]